MLLTIFPDIHSRVAFKIAGYNYAKTVILLRPLDLSEGRNNPSPGEDFFGWRAYKQLGDAVRLLVPNQLIQ